MKTKEQIRLDDARGALRLGKKAAFERKGTK
jgi:hypothetical protein